MDRVDLERGARTVRRFALGAMAAAFTLAAAAAATDGGAVWATAHGAAAPAGAEDAARAALTTSALALGVLGASGLLVTSLVLAHRREGRGGLTGLALFALFAFGATHAATRPLHGHEDVLTAHAFFPLAWHLAVAALVVALAVHAGSRLATATGVFAYGFVAGATVLGYVWFIAYRNAALTGYWTTSVHAAWSALPFAGATLAYAMHAAVLALLVVEEVRARERLVVPTPRARFRA